MLEQCRTLISPRHVHALIEQGVLRGLGVPKKQISLLRDCVVLEPAGRAQPVLAGRGSGPEMGADVLSGALMAVILRCIRTACRQAGISYESLD